MSHDQYRKRIFTKTESGVKKGVDIYDVQMVMGTGSRRDVAGIIDRAVTRGKINKWAKYKPLRTNANKILTDAERATLNQGLVIHKYTDISGVEGASGDWVYEGPRLGQTPKEWFRLHDFASTEEEHGYNKECRSFVESYQVPNRYVKGLGGIAVRVTVTPQEQLPQDNLYLTDFSDINGDYIQLSRLYLGVLLKGKKAGVDAYVYKTSSTPLNDYDSEIYIDGTTMDDFDSGSCLVYMLAAFQPCTTEQTQTGTINGSYLRFGAYILPNVPVCSLIIAVNQSSMVINRMTVTLGTGRVVIGPVNVRYGGPVDTPVSNVIMKFYSNTGASS